MLTTNQFIVICLPVSCLKNLKIKICMYKTIILPVVLHVCENWSLAVREEHRLRVLENRVLDLKGRNCCTTASVDTCFQCVLHVKC